MSEQAVTKQLVAGGLRGLADKIQTSRMSYNPTEEEMIWYSLAKKFWPELLHIINDVSDRMLPSGGATFYKKK